MSLNNECTCKRVLVFPRVEERVSAIIMAQMPISSPNLENYYNKKETDEMLAEKLSTSELDNAIDKALLEAKESGEFKGEKGEQGIQGVAGKDGVNGQNGLNGLDGRDGANGRDGTFATSYDPTTKTLSFTSTLVNYNNEEF